MKRSVLRSRLRIDDRYLDIVPRPSKDDRWALKSSIAEHGQQIPITCDQDLVVVDGHTRVEACEELGIRPKYRVTRFRSEADKRRFAITTNLQRRNLTMFQKIELSWEIYEIEMERARRRMGWMKHSPGAAVTGADGRVRRVTCRIKEGQASQIFGKYVGCGRETIHKTAYLRAHADAALLDRLRTGDISITTAYFLLRGTEHIMQTRRRHAREGGPSTSPSSGAEPPGEAPGRGGGSDPLPEPAPASRPGCPSCGAETGPASGCHVHGHVCCTSCEWGE